MKPSGRAVQARSGRFSTSSRSCRSLASVWASCWASLVGSPARGIRHGQGRGDADEQLAGGEGLDDVVVGPRAQPFRGRLLARARRKEDHGSEVQRGIAADGPRGRSRRARASSRRRGRDRVVVAGRPPGLRAHRTRPRRPSAHAASDRHTRAYPALSSASTIRARRPPGD